MYSRICLICHLKEITKSDDLGKVTNYAIKLKLYQTSLSTLS